MKVLLARIPDLVGLSGTVTVGLTALQQSTILNNSGVAESFVNSDGDIFSAEIEEDLTL